MAAKIVNKTCNYSWHKSSKTELIERKQTATVNRIYLIICFLQIIPLLKPHTKHKSYEHFTNTVEKKVLRKLLVLATFDLLKIKK